MPLHLLHRKRNRRTVSRLRRSRGNHNIHQLALDLSAALQNQPRDQRIGHRSGIEVRTALEPVRSIRVQHVPPRAAPNARRIEPRRLHQNVLRLRRNHRVPAAHHARQRQRLLLIGDDQIVGLQRALGPVQQPQLLALARQPHHDAALDLVQIERMRGMPHPHQHKVADIDGIRDLLLLQQAKVFSNPPRARRNRHIAQHPRRKSSAKLRRLNPHRKGFAPGVAAGSAPSSGASGRL